MIYDNSKRDHFTSEILNIVQHLPKINTTMRFQHKTMQPEWMRNTCKISSVIQIANIPNIPQQQKSQICFEMSLSV